MADTLTDERIVMTPRKKTGPSTVIMMERLHTSPAPDLEESGKVHVAGGDHKGIIVNKEAVETNDILPPQLSLEFKVFLVSASTQTHTQESRQLRFWFKKEVPDSDQPRMAQEFFKELVSPLEFPRDYVGFIKKIMKLMQNRYVKLKKVEVELKQLGDTEKPPSRPISLDDSTLGRHIEVTEDLVLELIESVYPNPVTVTEMAKQCQCEEEEVHVHLEQLQAKGVIKTLDSGAYTRVVQNEMELRVVKQMPTIASSKQPTIAIITSQYFEKVAVDAMIENQETFVRYTTIGESNVYTLGNIGAHRVVSTKLTQVGHTREAMIAAGNSTTRLLGTFQKVDFVFLVGVGGGVPHYTDYYQHVRLGDVVVSAPPEDQRFIYMYCDDAKVDKDGGFVFDTKSWGPPNLLLQDIAAQLKSQYEQNIANCPWAQYIETGMAQLSDQEADFHRPAPETDRLYMSIGGKDVIEVGHPPPPEGAIDFREGGLPNIHFGPIASGRQVVKEDQVRQNFATNLGILAYDPEFDAVVESIYGNRKDSYIFLRGISDYKDGTKRNEWQAYSALVAAAYMKAIICGMEPPIDE